MTNAFTPPLLAPDLQRKKFELERAAQMGRALMEDGSQMPQGQMISGHYVAPSLAQYIAQGLKSYIGGKAMNSIPDRLADIQRSQQDYDRSLFYPQQTRGGVTGPDLQHKQMEFQQNQMLAKALMQQGMQPNEGRMISGHYVRPDAGRAIANAFSLYAGMKGMQDAPQQMADLQKMQRDYDSSLFGLGGQAGGASPQAIGQVLAAGAEGGSVGPTNQNAAQLGQALAGKPVMPYLFPNDPQRSMMAYQAMGPGDYMKAVASQQAPTDVVKNMVAAGLDPNSPQGRVYLSQVLTKNASNMINVRPGGTVFDANAGAPLYHAPGTNGVQVAETPRGPVMYNVPGSTDAIANASTASAAGPATFQTQTVNLPDGSNVLTTKRAVGEQIQNQPAPLRNNNPGALMPGGKLASYPTMEAGLQALDGNLARYGQQGVNTISGVIGKWAPPNENDTQAYIKDVATRLGIDPNQQIDLSKPLVRHAIGTAIALHESGPGAVFGSAGPAAPQQNAPRGIPVQGEGTIAANTELGKDQAKELTASRDQAVTATTDLTNIAQARQTLSGGTFGGSGAQAKLNAAKFVQSWLPVLGGSIDPNKVTNTDYLVSVLGKGLLTHAKELGYNPTDADAARIESIVGTIGKDPQALAKILDYQEMMAKRTIERHNALVAQAQQNGIQSNFNLSVSPGTGMPSATEQTPPPPQSPPAGGFKIVGVR